MKNNKLLLIFLVIIALVVPACKKVVKVMSVTTGSVSNKLATSVLVSGRIIDLGEGVTQYGHCYSTTQNPTVTGSKTELGIPSDTGTFSSNLIDLIPETNYYVRAYLLNKGSIVYGNQVNFITSEAFLPSIATSGLTSITFNSVISGGNVTNDGNAPVSERGVCWNRTGSPTIADNKTSDGSGNGIFISNITGLEPGAGYSLRAYATNYAGTSYGNELIFTTDMTAAILKTTLVSLITSTSFITGGTITFAGGPYISNCGVCWSTTPSPTIDNNTTSDWTGEMTFVSSVTGLAPNTTYYLRAYATNGYGVGYGNQIVVKTYTGTIADICGNIYNTITIGTQVWMRENLKTTLYQNGDAILNETNGTAWVNLTSGAYCWYDNNVNNKSIYGAIYNFYAVQYPGGLCPVGWHVATEGEWNTLISFLGQSNVVGAMLKDTTLWNSPNAGADNSSGFTALPGGCRGWEDGRFDQLGLNGYWWTGTWNTPLDPVVTLLRYNSYQVNIYSNRKQDGFSVRCIKDN